ncbi:MAG: divergent PAP2 family protein [Huintestinicola sp.]
MYYNYILVTAVCAWCISQLLKTIITLCKFKKFSVERLFGAGGWPSAHSAMVCSATVGVCRVRGAGSVEFGIMCILALITMYDAMGVRRAAGLHAHEINKINRFIVSAKEEMEAERQNSDNPTPVPKSFEEVAAAATEKFKEMKEFLGHTPFEVLSGAILGSLIAFLVPVFWN